MTNSESAPAFSDVADLSYEQAASELDAIVGGLDSGAVDIDTLTVQFQRAIDLVEELDGRINRTRDQVERLTSRLEAIGEQKNDS